MTSSNEIYEQVLLALRRITRAIDIHSRKLVQVFGLTGPQLIVLQEIVRNKESSLTRLARAVKLSNPTVTGIVSRLESRGLVCRVRSSQDKRQVIVTPTDGAHELLQRAPTPLQERFIQEFSRLKDWEQSQILSSIQRVATMMDAEELPAEPVLSGETTSPAGYEVLSPVPLGDVIHEDEND